MSASSEESQDESVTYTKSKKIKRTSKSLRLMPSEEEKKYRNKNFKNVDIVSDFSDKLKCTKCFANLKSAILEGRDVYSHPLLKVLMCKGCVDYYGNGDFSLDEDDEDKYCRWCGQGKMLFVCSKCICGFCPKCITKHFGAAEKKKIEADDDWVCYFCEPSMLYELRAICALALEASSKNRKEVRNKRESKLISMSKKESTSKVGRSARKSLRGSSPNTSASEKGNASEPIEVTIGSESEEEIKSEKEREKSKTPKIVLKRKRSVRTSKVNGKAVATADTSSEETDGAKRAVKKQKTSTKESASKGKSKVDDKLKKQPDSSGVESDSSTDSEEDADADAEAQPSSSVNSNLIVKSRKKLAGFFKIAEMNFQLGLDVCRKRLKKLENKDLHMTADKISKECEKLKSVVALQSTCGATMTNAATSLQTKLGIDAKAIDVASLFSDHSDDSVLRLFSLFLRGMDINQTIKLPETAKESPKKQESSPKKEEAMEVDDPKPENPIEKEIVVDEEETEIRKEEEPEKPEEKKDEALEEKGEAETNDQISVEPKNSEKEEDIETQSTNNEDVMSALEDIFAEDEKKEKETMVNGDPEKSPSKSPAKTDEISLKIMTQVEKSGNLNDLESASTSKGIEGTVTDS